MNMSALGYEISRWYPHWTLSIKHHGEHAHAEITVPSREFCGFGPTVEKALAQAVERFRTHVTEHERKRYDV